MNPWIAILLTIVLTSVSLDTGLWPKEQPWTPPQAQPSAEADLAEETADAALAALMSDHRAAAIFKGDDIPTKQDLRAALKAIAARKAHVDGIVFAALANEALAAGDGSPTAFIASLRVIASLLAATAVPDDVQGPSLAISADPFAEGAMTSTHAYVAVNATSETETRAVAGMATRIVGDALAQRAHPDEVGRIGSRLAQSLQRHAFIVHHARRVVASQGDAALGLRLENALARMSRLLAQAGPAADGRAHAHIVTAVARDVRNAGGHASRVVQAIVNGNRRLARAFPDPGQGDCGRPCLEGPRLAVPPAFAARRATAMCEVTPGRRPVSP